MSRQRDTKRGGGEQGSEEKFHGVSPITAFSTSSLRAGTAAQSQNVGSCPSRCGPILTAPVRIARPVLSLVSTATPHIVAAPLAATKRPEDMPVAKRLIGSVRSIPTTDS